MKTKTYIIGGLILVLGVFLGSTVFSSKSQSEEKHNHAQDQADDSVWTCSMHPQIRKDEAGDCPICGMELIPASQMEHEIDPDAIRMSKSARQLAQVETVTVGSQDYNSNLSLSGRLEVNQDETQSISANFNARVEKLYVNEEGEAISKNQVIAELYAPNIQVLKEELSLATQQENLELLKSIKTKIQNYQLTLEDVKSIKNGKLKLRSPQTGVITQLNIKQGDNIKVDQSLMQIADLSRLWGIVDVYENDLNQIRVGDELTIQTPNHQNISGKISFISPTIDNDTRSAKARVVVENSDLKLKPGVFITANILQNEPNTTKSKSMTVPKSAVLWTGKRSVVYQQFENDKGLYYKMKEVQIGASTSDVVEIESGLNHGDVVVTHGAFSIDSEAQLANKPSMMNPEGKIARTAHQHGNMEMQDKSTKTSNAQPILVEQLVNQYTNLKDKLVADDFEASKIQYKKVNDLLSKLDLQSFKTLDKINSLEQLREEFITLSEQIISIVKTSNPIDKTIYVQQCPLANRGEGAQWLSFSQQIKNPYYGASMLKCGSVIDSIP